MYWEFGNGVIESTNYRNVGAKEQTKFSILGRAYGNPGLSKWREGYKRHPQ